MDLSYQEAHIMPEKRRGESSLDYNDSEHYYSLSLLGRGLG